MSAAGVDVSPNAFVRYEWFRAIYMKEIILSGLGLLESHESKPFGAEYFTSSFGKLLKECNKLV